MTYILVIFLNLAAIYIIKSPGRFWMACIPLFIILTGYYFIEQELNQREVAALQAKYSAASESMMTGAHDAWMALKKHRAGAHKFSNLMINLILLQSAITLAFQVIGLNRTKLNLYRYTTWIFVVIFIILLSFWFMIGIVPPGCIVR